MTNTSAPAADAPRPTPDLTLAVPTVTTGAIQFYTPGAARSTESLLPSTQGGAEIATLIAKGREPNETAAPR